MILPSVCTLVRNREGHLHQLVEGLRRSSLQPAELIIIDMSDVPVTVGATDFPVRIERLPTEGLPLAKARNQAAALATQDSLLFLDVDCIPMRDCLGRLQEELAQRDALLCADVRYLGPDSARSDWTEAELLGQGKPHPVRDFPEVGVRAETNPGLFWSLAFAIRKQRFENLGGFDEGFAGYGAEDTDFGFRAAQQGLPLLFVGGALACHQYHPNYEPPLQHLTDIVRNARHFHARWRAWPMEGWLAAFQSMGLIAWDNDVRVLRLPTEGEVARARIQ